MRRLQVQPSTTPADGQISPMRMLATQRKTSRQVRAIHNRVDAHSIPTLGGTIGKRPNRFEQAHQSERCLDGNWIRFDKMIPSKEILAVNGTGPIKFAAQSVTAERVHFRGNLVRCDGDCTTPTECKERQRDGIVAGKYVNSFGTALASADI